MVKYWNKELETDKEALDKFQKQSLHWTVKYAFENVPFYHETFRKLNLYPEDIKTFEDLKRLPIINKKTLREDQNLDIGKFGLSATSIENSTPYLTSGTVGIPAVILKTDEEWRIINAGSSVTALYAMGIKKGDRILNHLPFVEVPITVGGKQYKGKNISGEAAKHTIELMGCSEVKPTDINEKCAESALGLSTQIDRLGAKWFSEGKDPKKLGFKSVMVTGEPSSRSKKKYIADTFDTEVHDVHGSTEFLLGLFDCEYHQGMHANYHVHAEVINPETRENLSEGEEGHLVMTGLLPQGVKGGTVLLNYDIEDVTKKLGKECRCGRILDVFDYTRRSSNEFVVGAVKFKSEEFEQLLCDFRDFKYITPEYQIVVDFDERPEIRQDILAVNLEKRKLVETPENFDNILRDYILKNHPFLNDTVSREAVKFEVNLVEGLEFPRGKPKRLIDKRTKI